MKVRILISTILLALLIASACVPITDPRTPADATATNVARAALTVVMATQESVQATATATALEPTMEATPAPECLIKGNISRTGEKIYHVQGQLNYNRTVIDPELGEQWFCSEADAVAAGWRKALQ